MPPLASLARHLRGTAGLLTAPQPSSPALSLLRSSWPGNLCLSSRTRLRSFNSRSAWCLKAQSPMTIAGAVHMQHTRSVLRQRLAYCQCHCWVYCWARLADAFYTCSRLLLRNWSAVNPHHLTLCTCSSNVPRAGSLLCCWPDLIQDGNQSAVQLLSDRQGQCPPQVYTAKWELWQDPNSSTKDWASNV